MFVTNVFVFYIQNKAFEINSLKCILFSKVVLVEVVDKKLMKNPTIAEKYSICHTKAFFPSWYSSSVPYALPLKKVPQATDRKSKHPYIG